MKTKRNYKQNIKNQVNDMEHSNPKAYWQLVEKTKDAESPIQSSSSVSLTDWTGIDIVSDEMLKASSPFLIDIYCQLFKTILQRSHYPKSWKTGMIISLFKDGNACDPYNYRA